MTILALAAPTVFVPDPTFTTFTLPAGTSPGANTGFTLINSPEGLVYAVVNMGSTVVTATVLGVNGVANVTCLLTVSVPNFIGPFDPAKYSTAAGLVQINLSVVTGITGVASVIMSAAAPVVTMKAAHNPFEMVAGATDR